MNAIDSFGYYFTEVEKPLEKRSFTIKEPGIDEVVVKVAGCGFCHTDLEFISGKVKTNAALPLILGHEMSGEVVAAGIKYTKLIGTNVIIPAVLPCGECALCIQGRSNICRNRKMPGNDFNGGFAGYVTVPGRFLCALPPNLGEFRLSHLSVIADAITTPYQAFVRSGLKVGDLSIVIGVGGLGIYMVQLAARCGAAVIAVDIDDSKIQQAKRLGARFGITVKEDDEKDLKDKIKTLVKEHRLPQDQWKVFETSGSAGGQNAAFQLLSLAGTIGIVGFTMDKITIRLSNLMAFDADMFGNWGCKPEYYPMAVDMVLKKEINILDTIELRPLDSINEVIGLAKQRKLVKRVVFTPHP
jgi:6-hydroxycyclohex-1-ene-1-carbonyl-CoA dehydrogenase